MQNINDLEDLLLHYINDLYIAEEQILQAMPAIIEKAQHRSLKNALQHHLDLSAEQQTRLEKIVELSNDKRKGVEGKKSVNLSRNKINEQAGKGISGLIEEAEHLLNSSLSKEVMDAAIIACVQKVEHYEICAYGTALAFAHQLHFKAAETLLTESLDEEYDADDLLTALATASFNKEAAPEVTDNIVEGNEEVYQGLGGDETNGPKVSINERTVNSPGGRAGTSHRRYPTGESRGH